jgi:shikimate kinase
MGAGKTYIGRELSTILNIPFTDLDEFIELKHTLSINDIFHYYGEPFFREKENEALVEVSQKDNFILSPGGGIISNISNLKILNKNNIFKIFLNPSWEIISERILKSKRPLVQNLSEKSLFELYQKRIITYHKMANISFTTIEKKTIINGIINNLPHS